MHLLIFTIVLCLFNPLSAEEEKKFNITCSDYREYDGVNVTALQGTWRARQLVIHTEDRGEVEYNSCPLVNITLYPSTEAPLFQHHSYQRNRWTQEYKHLILVWNENGILIEYSLFFKDDSVGFWRSYEEQTGTFPGSESYRHFTGTVQVLKAVGDHLLLHFCQAPIDGNQAQLFSVLLSREPRKLKKWEIEAAHDLLRRKNLSVTTRRLVCGNGAHMFLAYSEALVLALMMALLRSW